MTIELIQVSLLHGVTLALISYGIAIPFRFLNLPDLTGEGAYPLAGAICATTIVGGISPAFAIMLAICSSGLMGLSTGLLYLRFKVNSLLGGIILSTMAYSINLRLLGKPNVGLFDTPSVFFSNVVGNISLMLCILVALVFPFRLFLKTELGLKFRAVGLNPSFAVRQDISVERYTLIGFFLAGGFIGLGGALTVQLQQYMDVGMGVGIVIHGLAALMIGEKIIGTKTITQQLLAPLIGALLYQQIQGLALTLGLAPSDLKFVTGAIILCVIASRAKSL